MSTEHLTISFTVNNTPEEAFAAITNVRGWWSGQTAVGHGARPARRRCYARLSQAATLAAAT
jgi:hypothetical protein